MRTGYSSLSACIMCAYINREYGLFDTYSGKFFCSTSSFISNCANLLTQVFLKDGIFFKFSKEITLIIVYETGVNILSISKLQEGQARERQGKRKRSGNVRGTRRDSGKLRTISH